MTCFMCKGILVEGSSTFSADMGNCIVIIKNVPSLICDQCGEVSYSDAVASRLEQITHSLIDKVNTEIAVVSYSEQAA